MKKYKYLFAVALFSMTMTGCSDFLDAENKTVGGKDADSSFGQDATTLLTSTYESFKTLVSQVDIYEQGTDLYVQTRGKNAGSFNEYSLNADDETVEDFYTNAYKSINYANGVISYAGSDSELGAEARFLRNYGYYLLTQQFGAVPYVTNYIANANRTYPRTELATIYSSMIEDLTDLYNNSDLEAQSHEGRASKQAVAALLAKTYLAAAWDLQTTLTNAEQGTYTVNSTEYFTQAAAWAETAINGVNLTMSFNDKWSPSNEGNAEEIFSIQYDRAGYPGDLTSGGHSLQNNFGGYYGECTRTGMKQSASENQQSAKSMALFEEGDQRYEGTFMTTFYNASVSNGVPGWGTEGYYAYYNRPNDRNTMPIAFRYYPYYADVNDVIADLTDHKAQYEKLSDHAVVSVAATILDPNGVKVFSFDDDGTVRTNYTTYSFDEYNNMVNNGVSVKKFDDASSDMVNKDNGYRDIVIFHVSDMYLVAAEAYLLAGQTAQALAKINAVRGRAGLATLNSFGDYQPQYNVSNGFTLNSLDLVLDERARELYAENQRWMDLRRTKQLVRYNVEFNQYVSNVAAMSSNSGEIKWYRPIPTTEINSNDGISQEDQNPGY